MLTAWPSTVKRRSGPAPTAPQITGPVLMPTRIRTGGSPRASSSTATSASARWIASPARTARAGSSPNASGAPKSAITQSPMYLSTAPPWRRIT